MMFITNLPIPICICTNSLVNKPTYRDAFKRFEVSTGAPGGGGGSPLPAGPPVGGGSGGLPAPPAGGVIAGVATLRALSVAAAVAFAAAI